MNNLTQSDPLCAATAHQELTKRLAKRARKRIARRLLGGHPVSTKTLIYSLNLGHKRASIQRAVLEMVASELPAEIRVA